MGAECHPAKLQDTSISAGGRASKQTLTSELEDRVQAFLKISIRQKRFLISGLVLTDVA